MRITERLSELIGPERASRYFPQSPRIRRKHDHYAVVVGNPFVADLLDRRHGQTLTSAVRELTGEPGAIVEFQVDPSGESIEQSSGAARGVLPQPALSEPSRAAAGEGPAGTKRPRVAAGHLGEPPPTPIPAPPGRSGPLATPPRTPHTPHTPRAPRTWLGNPGPALRNQEPASMRVRPRFVLEDFVVGPSNALAYESSMALSDGSQSPPFNLLVIHGACGLGKTHLMNGIATRFSRTMPGARIHCTTAEAFTNEYITAIRTSGLDRFRTSRRRTELLCIDDVHFLSNKTATQTEFLHTFDTLGLRGSRIVLVTDEHPSLIQRLSKELSSRMLSGMVVEVGAPDPQMRVRIILRLAERRGLPLAPGVAEAIADRSTGSVRTLVGAITTLDAVRRLPGMSRLDQRLSLSLVEQALGASSATRPPIRPIRVETITEVVAKALGVELSEVLGRGRHKRVVLARALTVLLAKDLTTRSYPEIARAMNRPNHSSVITARQRIDRQIRDKRPCDLGPAFEGVSIEEMAGRLRRTLLDSAERI
jgi:chromosomal replication initiator protein